MDELVEFYLNTLRTLLSGEGVMPKITWIVGEMVRGGNVDAGVLLETSFDKLPGGLTPPRRGLVAMVTKLAEYTQRLSGDEIAQTDLEGAATTLGELSRIAEELGKPAMAYNFDEACYHLLDICDQPALEVAKRLRRLANPDNVPQFYGAIWRLAAEELREAIDHGTGWLTALDAIEFALTCHIPHSALQQKLFDKLKAQVLRAQDTDIEELLLHVLFEAPTSIPTNTARELALAALVEARFGTIPDGTSPAIIEGLAAPLVQIAIGDLRLKFLPQN